MMTSCILECTVFRVHVCTSSASAAINLGPSHYRCDILGHTNVQALVDLAGGISSGVIAKLHPHHLEGTTSELVCNKGKETYHVSQWERKREWERERERERGEWERERECVCVCVCVCVCMHIFAHLVKKLTGELLFHSVSALPVEQAWTTQASPQTAIIIHTLNSFYHNICCELTSLSWGSLGWVENWPVRTSGWGGWLGIADE